MREERYNIDMSAPVQTIEELSIKKKDLEEKYNKLWEDLKCPCGHTVLTDTHNPSCDISKKIDIKKEDYQCVISLLILIVEVKDDIYELSGKL
jgi:hypothetical protein